MQNYANFNFLQEVNALVSVASIATCIKSNINRSRK
jgi:hypothetical protein